MAKQMPEAWPLRNGEPLPEGSWFRGLPYAGKNAEGREKPRYHLFKETVPKGEGNSIGIVGQCGASAVFHIFDRGPWVSDTMPKTKANVCQACAKKAAAIVAAQQKETAQ